MYPSDTPIGSTGNQGQQAPVPDNAVFNEIAEKIIAQQEAVIGPIAVEQARRVAELTVNWPEHLVAITGNPQTAIDELVAQYKELFGQIAVQTCKEAASRYLAQLPADQLPSSLR